MANGKRIDSLDYMFKGKGDFYEPPSTPKELLPKLVGATVHTFRYSTFIRETDLRAISINYDMACGLPYNESNPGKPHPLLGIFTDNYCPVLHIGYLAGHRQRWTSNGTALGEVVYSLSLAPGETRNIAVIDLRRRQQGSREEQTEATEQLISSQDHTFALQEVATAVALEHQYGKTTTEANTLVTGGAFVAAGALAGGISGGLIGTLIEPGGGTVVGAAVGAGAGVAAGGLVFAGAQAIGMIESESSGDRDIMGNTNQNIAQSTSQQSALIRSLWSTVVTEDVQEESLGVRTSNITNYNHMHALNMEYYEILHRYDALTELQDVSPILYLPFGALPLQDEDLIDEFWDSIRVGLTEDLRDKGDQVFVEPPPPDFVPEPVPDTPAPPSDVSINALQIDIEIEWDLDWADASRGALGVFLAGVVFGAPAGLTFGVIMSVADEVFRDGTVEIELGGNTYSRAARMETIQDTANGKTIFRGIFDRSFDAADVTGVRVEINSPFDFFDDNGSRIRLLVHAGSSTPPSALTLPGLQIASGDLDYDDGRGRKVYPWSPIGDVLAEYESKLAEIAELEQRNADGEAAHQAVLDQLAEWKRQVIEAVKRERYRFTMIILSSMETGRLTWILDRLYLSGDDENEIGAIPLHRIVHTTPIGISGDSVLLRMKSFDFERLQKILQQPINLDQESSDEFMDLLTWPRELAGRFAGDNADLSIEETVFLPGAGTFAEAILGRSNAAEYVDPDRYWNWQDSPIPHHAPGIQPVSTAPRATAPLSTEPTIPDATLAMATAPNFPDPVGLAGVLQGIQNGSIFRDMSKADQLASILGGLADLASTAASTAATMTGDTASSTLNAATDIGKTVASLTDQLMSSAPAQAAQPPGNPTTAAAASDAVERAQNKPEDVRDATKDAWGVPGSSTTPSSQTGQSNGEVASSPDQPWRPGIAPNTVNQPGQVSNLPGVPTQIQEEVEGEVREILDTAAEDTGAMPDPGVLIPQLEHWYRDGIIPLLVFARHNEEYLTSAINQYLDWLGSMQQLGLEDEARQMEELHGDGMTLIKAGLENAIKAAFTQMEANNNIEFSIDVFNWTATARQLGIDDQSPLFSLAEVAEESPIHVVLNGPLEPEGGFGVGDSFVLDLSGGLAVGANPPLEDKLVEVSISVENGTTVPSQGTIHPSLNLISQITRTETAAMKIEVTGKAMLFQGVWEFETKRTVTII